MAQLPGVLRFGRTFLILVRGAHALVTGQQAAHCWRCCP